MLTRMRTRRSGDGNGEAAASAADDPAMDSDADTRGNGGGGGRRSAFGNSARNAANRASAADGNDGKKKLGGGAAAASSSAAAAVPEEAAAGGRAGGKRGRPTASAAAAEADGNAEATKPGKKRNPRRSSRTSGTAATASTSTTAAGGKRKAVKSDPDAVDEIESKSNKRIKKEPGANANAAINVTSSTSLATVTSAIIPTQGSTTITTATSSTKQGASGAAATATAITATTSSSSLSLPSSADLIPPSHRLTRRTFDGTNLTTGLARHDLRGSDDPLHVASYVTDIYQQLYAAESKDAPHEYMDVQPDINAKMRAILIDWLVEVHMKFRLVPETLYLCVNLIDRYCQVVDVKRSELQLVGVTALLIACKYEEIYPPEVRDCVYITDRAYLRQQVLDMEQDILSKLEFRITVPTAYPFLSRFLTVVDASELVRHAASFYLERTLQEHDLLRYRPSVVAAAAVILALNNPDILEQDASDSTSNNGNDDNTKGGKGKSSRGKGRSKRRYESESENQNLQDSSLKRLGCKTLLLEYTGFDAAELREVCGIICTKVHEEPVTASRRQLVAVKRKFDHARYGYVSSRVVLPDLSHLG